MEPVADMMDVVGASKSLSRAIKEQPLVAKAFGQLQDRFAKFKKTAVQELDASKEKQLTALKNIISDAIKTHQDTNFSFILINAN